MQVDGGGTNSYYLIQRQADVVQIKINRPKNIETTALGGAMMAGYNLIWESMNDLKELNQTEKEYTPNIEQKINFARIRKM